MYPTLVNYIEAIGSLQGRLKHLQIKQPPSDNGGALNYRTKGAMAFFAVTDVQGQGFLLGVFLTRAARERFSPTVSDKIYPSELYVHCNSCVGSYFDVVLREVEAAHVVSPSFQTHTILQRPLSDGLRAFKDENEMFGYVDSEGGLVIDPRWDWADDFVEGRAVVQQDGLYGIIDKQGQFVVPLEYDDLSWDNSRYAYGDKNGRWGVIDREGNTVVNFEWDWVAEFHAGYAIVQQHDKYGFVDTTGKLIIEPLYDDATSFNEHGVARVTLGDQQFFIDPKQRRV